MTEAAARTREGEEAVKSLVSSLFREKMQRRRRRRVCWDLTCEDADALHPGRESPDEEINADDEPLLNTSNQVR